MLPLLLSHLLPQVKGQKKARAKRAKKKAHTYMKNHLKRIASHCIVSHHVRTGEDRQKKKGGGMSAAPNLVLSDDPCSWRARKQETK